jgi:hypothetical protein
MPGKSWLIRAESGKTRSADGGEKVTLPENRVDLFSVA